jgi:DNA polymerase/3'-5' exonuclease PolX
MSTYDQRTPHLEAQQYAVTAKDQIVALNGDLKVTFMGSLRRKCEDVGDVDLMVTTENWLLQGFDDCTMPDWLTVTRKKAHGWLASPAGGRMMIDAWWCPYDSRGPFALFLTGPPDLNVWMRQRVNEARPDVMLSQYGLFRKVPAPTKMKPDRTVAGERVDTPWPGQQSEVERAFWEQWCEIVGRPYRYPKPEERDNWRRVVNA